MNDLFDPEVRAMLDDRTEDIAPPSGALDRVHAVARKRRRRRRVAVGTSALLATSVALAFAGGVLREPLDGGGHRPVASGGIVQISDPSMVRHDLGITGRTKGAGQVVVAKSPSPDSKQPAWTLVQTDTGFSEELPNNTKAATLSPQQNSVAMVTKGNTVVVQSTSGAVADRTVVKHQRPGANISWDPRGTALFALIDGHWTRVPAPTAAGTIHTSASVRVLGVPRLPGGPSFLSVSPSRDYTLLFGVATAGEAGGHRAGARPHLYLGRFDGKRRVSHLDRIAVPRAARQEPMGWLGDNAFVIGTGADAAWIVRVDGSHVVVAAALPDGCSLEGAPVACRSRGPRVLGTNADGSLLYWRVRGVPTQTADGADAREHGVVAFFSTWLDGSHPKQLTGPAGTYGPATAAR